MVITTPSRPLTLVAARPPAASDSQVYVSRSLAGMTRASLTHCAYGVSSTTGRVTPAHSKVLPRVTNLGVAATAPPQRTAGPSSHPWSAYCLRSKSPSFITTHSSDPNRPLPALYPPHLARNFAPHLSAPFSIHSATEQLLRTRGRWIGFMAISGECPGSPRCPRLH